MIGVIKATIYSLGGNSTCFIGNWDESNDANVTFQAKPYNVPAWSVSILSDCNQETYNTAKVNAQTSVLEKKSPSQGQGQTQDIQPLKWEWRNEAFSHLHNPEKAKGVISANRLFDQKEIANDTSDYLWYMTSITLNDGDVLLGKPVTLQVNTSGPILHAFFNGKYIGSQNENTFQKSIVLVKGLNRIALLSVTVGFPNYGAFFDLTPAGVTGPVQLVANANGETITKDLSNNTWTYKVGLDGDKRKFYSARIANKKWHDQILINGRMFTWYKTTFSTPIGTEPVVLDFKGLSKGHAWVNGNSLGRYWVSVLAPSNGCSQTCDYHGNYNPDKCNTNCGQATQRWYHVPRSFLNNDGNNTLVLFEEFGGNPAFVVPQTVSQTKVCANAYEGSTLTLSCQEGKSISAVEFVSFGDPMGSCGAFKKGTCESTSALVTITQACVGKTSCSFNVTEQILGPTGCHASNKLAVQASC